MREMGRIDPAITLRCHQPLTRHLGKRARLYRSNLTPTKAPQIVTAGNNLKMLPARREPLLFF